MWTPCAKKQTDFTDGTFLHRGGPGRVLEWVVPPLWQSDTVREDACQNLPTMSQNDVDLQPSKTGA